MTDLGDALIVFLIGAITGGLAVALLLTVGGI